MWSDLDILPNDFQAAQSLTLPLSPGSSHPVSLLTKMHDGWIDGSQIHQIPAMTTLQRRDLSCSATL